MSNYCAIINEIKIPKFLRGEEWENFYFYVGNKKTKYYQEALKWHNSVFTDVSGLSICLISFKDEVCEIIKV